MEDADLCVWIHSYLRSEEAQWRDGRAWCWIAAHWQIYPGAPERQQRRHLFRRALDRASLFPRIAPPAGASASVDIPSGEVKLNNEFVVTGSATTMLLDFDGDQSIHQTGSGNGNGNKNAKYMMSPVIRVVSIHNRST